jgi:hypothetical protein
MTAEIAVEIIYFDQSKDEIDFEGFTSCGLGSIEGR